MCLGVAGMHGEVEEVWSGGSACWFDRSLVPGDVNPHGNGLCACEADGCAVVVEVGATPLLESLEIIGQTALHTLVNNVKGLSRSV